MVRTLHIQLQGVQVPSLVGKLRSHMLQGTAKKVKTIFLKGFNYALRNRPPDSGIRFKGIWAGNSRTESSGEEGQWTSRAEQPSS